MRRGSGVALGLVFLLLASLVPAVRVSGDALPPTITALRWSPRYPIIPSNVTLYANVSDPDGVAFVQATWCAVPPYLCTYPQMFHIGGGVYVANATTFTGAVGASYEVYAQDNAGNGGNTSALYALFVDSLHLRLTPSNVQTKPGAQVTVNGTAFYGPTARAYDRIENGTAPAVGIAVNVTVDGATHRTTIDATGNFTVTFAAPGSDGSYPIDVTAKDRNLTGTTAGTMAVSTVPRPDLTIANAQVSPAEPVAGGTILLRFDAQNVGSENATNVRVLVDVIRGAALARVLDTNVAMIPKGGGSVALTAHWTSTAGPETVRIHIDPDSAIPELSETNNIKELDITVLPPPPPSDIPVVVWIGLGGAGIAAVAVAALLVMRRRRRPRIDDPGPDEGKGS